MNKSPIFYGIFTSLGYGVYISYSKTPIPEQCLENFHIKKFETFQEAEKFAISGYNEYVLMKNLFPDIQFPENLKLRWGVYPKKKTK